MTPRTVSMKTWTYPEARWFTCPTCNARPRTNCVTLSGHRKMQSHSARRNVFDAAKARLGVIHIPPVRRSDILELTVRDVRMLRECLNAIAPDPTGA